MKHAWTVLAVGGLFLAVLALGTYSDPDAVRPVVVWTARLTLPLFVAAFVSFGPRALPAIRQVACRSAAFAMALHLLAVMRLAQLTGKAPLAFGTVPAALVSLGGAGAAGVLLSGWLYWDRPWYRWAMYWPWGVFLFTYLFLARSGEETGRIFAAPLTFLPVVLVLLGAFVWRLRSDFKVVKP
jgi:hypothetical protein